MPTYEYHCLNCGTQFEAFQKMSESPLERCIACQGSVRRVISGGSGLIFKGSGFYITDYAAGKKTEASGTTEGKDPEPIKTKGTAPDKAVPEQKSTE